MPKSVVAGISREIEFECSVQAAKPSATDNNKPPRSPLPIFDAIGRPARTTPIRPNPPRNTSLSIPALAGGVKQGSKAAKAGGHRRTPWKFPAGFRDAVH